jgi:hypothetical protein
VAKRVLLGITYGTLGIALTVALTLGAFELAGRNLSSAAGSANFRLVGEDVRPPRAPAGSDRSHGRQQDQRHVHARATVAPPAPSAPTSTGTAGGSSTTSDGHNGSGSDSSPSGSGGGHDHEPGDD